MLKRIPVKNIRLGMFVAELCGSWMEHPFEKTKFLLIDQTDLDSIHSCGIKEVWIDTAKGLDDETTASLSISTPDEMTNSTERLLKRASKTKKIPHLKSVLALKMQ
jgi:hypothetical protein